ncbi:MAG: hypothetical protein BMS9Abin20_0674 [Acidimicrobiia bacterium]|nr:MAG: hypothetical protein BMS9Abin20_0674 [Acidimicrobiia bacterium]
MHRSAPGSLVESDPGDLYPLRILLVDDGAAVSKTFRRLSDGVEIGRYIVDRVTNPADGFRAIVADEHDVYVVDHHVGTRTGFDVLSWANAGGLRVPIVFVAGSGDHGTGVTAVGAGASCYVVEDSIDSGLLDHCLRHAVEQLRALSRLSRAGIEVDSGISTEAQLLSRIAERLREPVAALLDVTRRCLESDLPALALESFGSIEDKANTLVTLANDLNDLSMLEAGHLQFDTETFSLRGLVSHVRQTVGSVVSARGLEIIVDISADVPDAVVGDPGRLRLVIVRFIETVTARSSTKRIVLRVGVEHRSAGAITLLFEIEACGGDSIVGDTPASGRELIEPGEAPAMLLDRGVLGMPVALETVSRMGGRVTADGDQDHTAAVQFTVRLQVGDDGRAYRPTVDGETSLEGPILVITHDVDAQRSIIETLEGAGFAHLAASSVEAWAAAMGAANDENVTPALAVIDSTRDSFAVCDRFNEITAASVPVVVVVASGKRGDAARCRERGVRGYLARPLGSGDLVDVIRSTMALTESGDTTTLVTRHWLREGRPSLHVLVVDDSATNRFLLTRMLEQRGHSAATACDGREAVEASERSSFDVVLMDVMMPDMDGLEATRLIRQMHTGSDRRPFIVGVSAFADQLSIDRADDAGMDGFLAKPVRPDDLFTVVEQKRSALSVPGRLA